MTKKIREYESPDIIVRYDAGRCIHFAECVHGLPTVFNPDARPWINPEGADADQVAAAVTACPTGALTFERKDGGPDEPAPPRNTAVVSKDGPVLVAGDLHVTVSGEEDPLLLRRVALCRCGASANKPFCDGKHEDVGFSSAGDVATREDQEGESSGPLRIRLAPNGPVLFEGPLDIRSDDLETVVTLQKGALCRCGQSSTKPFCDGTHNKAGFSA